jgi:sensor histidine kinase YesM
MSKISFFDLMDQKKAVSHLSFIMFAVFVSAIMRIGGKFSGSPYSIAGVFLLLFFQMEVFIYIGHLLFARVSFEGSPREITWIVTTRLIIFLLFCLLVAITFYLILQYIFAFILGGDPGRVFPDFVHTGFRQMIQSTATGLIIGALIFIILQWQASLRREQKLREEKLIFQNQTLKSQLNPHFLFNSLNTLSSLVVSEPETAELFINRLSSIYRYILENSAKDRVPLETELAFINDYFILHKIRDKDKILVEVNISDSADYEILPVSLQILVENAIKHNKATREAPLTILIYIENNYVVVRNNLQRMALQLKSTQIGLKNLGQRVKLTTGKELIIEETTSEFIVKIPLIR